MNKTQQLQRIIEEYRAAGEKWPASSRAMAEWAIRTKLWEPHRSSAITQCARELSRAMHDDYITDPQGRRVRRKHVVPGEAAIVDGKLVQQFFWVDLYDATRDQIQAALQHRRKQILADCNQLKNDQDSYNENNSIGAEIQLSFDFRDDLNELRQPDTYPGISA